MISTEGFLAALAERGFGPFLGVPCSFFTSLTNCALATDSVDYLTVNNEGEAVAIGAGTALAGKRPVVLFQNSGLGNAVNPLTSLVWVFRIPLLLIVTWRGAPDVNDAPQHRLMGAMTPGLLDSMQIGHGLFPAEEKMVEPALDAADQHLRQTGLPYALVMRKGTLTEYSSTRDNVSVTSPAPTGKLLPGEMVETASLLMRREIISTVVRSSGGDAAIVGTTGKTARELFAYHDRPANFYMVGSMGCASSFSLGVALARPDHPTVVLDGDGAALMRLEAMASIGHYAPPRFLHVLVDNAAYESTGGQETLSPTVGFPEIAIACGYRSAVSVRTSEALRVAVDQAILSQGPHLIHVRSTQGTEANLGRPTLTPPELAERFRRSLTGRPDGRDGTP